MGPAPRVLLRSFQPFHSRFIRFAQRWRRITPARIRMGGYRRVRYACFTSSEGYMGQTSPGFESTGGLVAHARIVSGVLSDVPIA